MTEIMLLGCFHFGQSDFDLAKSNEDLKVLLAKLTVFEPNAVAVQEPKHQQGALDAAFCRYLSETVSNRLENNISLNLGEIRRFGHIRQISCRNENVQIGFELAKMLGLSRAYAIDDDKGFASVKMLHKFFNGRSIRQASGWPGNLPAEIKLSFDQYAAGLRESNGLFDELELINTNRWTLNTEQESHVKNIVLWHGNWRKRNEQIFENILFLSQIYKRIFALIGAAHLSILHELINAESSLKLVMPF